MTREPEEDVAQAIEMTRLCQALHCLPDEGGLLNQDSYHVWLMQQVLAADVEAENRDTPSS